MYFKCAPIEKNRKVLNQSRKLAWGIVKREHNIRDKQARKKRDLTLSLPQKIYLYADLCLIQRTGMAVKLVKGKTIPVKMDTVIDAKTFREKFRHVYNHFTDDY